MNTDAGGPHAFRAWLAISMAGVFLLLSSHAAAAVPETSGLKSGKELYLAACANCHGAYGNGAPASLLAFEEAMPDFTDCDFANREPDEDWIGVMYEGGPSRGFSEMMPAFGEALTLEELRLILVYVRTFCQDDSWPRGDLNLPRALVTEKAFVEDEAVFTATVDTEELDMITAEVVYEQRFGARNQVELKIPFGWREYAPNEDDPDQTEWGSSLGDMAVGVKRAFYHSLPRGSILSATAEIILPTGDDERGFGKGTTVFEPFLSYGQILPAGFFLHSQAGVEIPFDRDKADDEGFLRLVLGRTFTVGRWGRAWSPMVEILSARDFVSGADTNFDLVPQIQVSLNTRQHVLLNLGVRTPLNNTGDRTTRVMVYLLWDWFDGGLFEGW